MGVLAFFDESAISEKIAQLEKDGIPHIEITGQDVVDNFFFDAYTVSESGELGVDFEKAKNIQKDKWRMLREPILKDLDVQFMRALEAGDQSKQDAIKLKKQQLRDITLIQLPDSLDAIKANIPDILQ